MHLRSSAKDIAAYIMLLYQCYISSISLALPRLILRFDPRYGAQVSSFHLSLFQLQDDHRKRRHGYIQRSAFQLRVVKRSGLYIRRFVESIMIL